MSSGVPSLIFRSGRCALRAAAARMFAGVSSDRVKAVTTGRGGGRPASWCTGAPSRFAFQSHSAQSTALRAAPGPSASCRSCREMSSGSPSISAVTLSSVSP